MLSVDIYTPGRGTSVKITGQLAGGEIDETVVVTRDSPVSIHTLVKQFFTLLVFMHIAGTSQSGCGRNWTYLYIEKASFAKRAIEFNTF